MSQPSYEEKHSYCLKKNPMIAKECLNYPRLHVFKILSICSGKPQANQKEYWRHLFVKLRMGHLREKQNGEQFVFSKKHNTFF